ncbi:hypothetical protein P4B35_10475 [Pontiellaceae bacterium B12227]|nr:hypothetical protein [Pontiellaceae bacterium B12227]
MSLFPKLSALSLLVALPLSSVALQRTDLLPPQGRAYVSISNTSDFLAELQQSSIGKLWADQQFQDFIGNPDKETLNSFFFDGESKEEDDVFVEQMKMLTGEVILAFDIKKDDIYIIADMSEDDFKRGLELDDRLRNVIENPFEIVKSSFQGVEIVQHIDSPGSADENSSWQTHVGRTFVLGYSREWVEQCIVRLKKDEMKEPKGNPTMTINLPVNALVLDSVEGQEEDRALFDALGLLGVENFSCRIELRDSEMVVDNNLSVDDLRRGLFALLDTEPSELPTVTFIPENLASLEVGRFDLFGLWKEIPTILTQADPDSKPQFDMMLAMVQQQTGINLEQDLLAHLGTKYLAFSTEGKKQTSIIALELEDGISFKQGLESALTAPSVRPYVASALEISDFLDHAIYTLKDAPQDDTVGIAITDDYLLYGEPEGLRQIIRSISSEAAANMAFEQTELVKGLRKEVPGAAFGFGAIDWKRNMDAILAELIKPEYRTLIEQNWATSGSALPPPDFNKLPPADHIASFFNVSYQYVEANNNGLHQKIILKY